MTTMSDGNSGCLTAILRLLGIEPETFPYRTRDNFFSSAEGSFYHVLCSVVGTRAVVCPKVGLQEIFFVRRPDANQASRNRIAQKHLDFLLCEPKTMRPIVGIELDDASHARYDRKKRDEFVDGVFQVAGLDLLRFPTQFSYDAREIASRVIPLLEKVADKSSVPTVPDVQTANVSAKTDNLQVPQCPKCGIPMVVRTAGRGEYRGKRFYGCPNYPKCHETLSLG
jgi:hypothetical protein